MNRLERLAERRTDPMIKSAAQLNEVYRHIQQSDAVRYAIGAMQPIDPEYTKNTFAQGDRVKNQLEKRLSQATDFRYQGSTTNDTHIRARSDIDLLVILNGWCWLEPPQKAQFPYSGDEKHDMRELRNDSHSSLQTAFPEVNVDCSGSKSIAMEGGSLTRKIDVVPATWWNTNDYANSGNEVYRGVKIFDATTLLFISNLPFLHNLRIDGKDNRTFGGMRKAARLMKSLKYDSDDLDMSSYDITGIAYNMPDEMLAYQAPFELRIVESCRSYCRELRQNDALRYQIAVPNNSRKVFDAASGTNLTQLDQMIHELDALSQDILRENARSFVKLAEARVEHPMRLTPVGF